MAFSAQSASLGPANGIQVGDRLEYAATVTSADVNQDGKPDLIVGHALGVTVFMGRGASRFDLGRLVRLNCMVMSVVASDFNGDAIPDIAALCPESGRLSILLGKGAGEFAAAAILPVRAYRAHGLLAADLNKDGVADLAVGQFDGVALFAGVGDGTFRPIGKLTTAHPVLSFVARDFNGDSLTDVASSDGNTIRLWVQSAAGVFEAFKSTVTTACTVNEITADDFNRDGRLDLAAACGSAVVLALGGTDGNFGNPITLALRTMPISIASADLNGDRVPDLVYGTTSSGRIGILLGKGDGTFASADELFAFGNEVACVAISDLNGDSRADVAAAEWDRGSALVAFGTGNGKFESPVYLGVPAHALRTLDFARTARPDLVILDALRREIRLLRRASEPMATLDWSGYPFDARSGDFNRDMVPDLLVASLGSLSGSDLLLSVQFVEGRSGGGFLPPRNVVSLPYISGEGLSAPALVVGEFTGDALLDFVLADNSAGTLRVFSGDGKGGFSPAATRPARARLVAAGDFNNDGIDDIAASAPSSANASEGSVYLMGPGGFVGVKPFSTCSYPAQLMTASLAGPKSRDLVAVCEDEISVLLNDGGGNLRSSNSRSGVSLKSSFSSAGVADVNNDGRDDLVVVRDLNDLWGGATALASNGDGTFRAVAFAALPPMPGEMAVGHWDDDGVPEIAIFSGREFTVSTHRLVPAEVQQ